MSASNFQSTKIFRGYPCSHRQWRHPGHCAWVHGYSRSFHYVFECQELDECGFVVDYGGLKDLKAYLDDTFDHTLLLNKDDPLLENFKQLEVLGACKIRVLPHGVGMEGTARHLCEYTDKLLREKTDGRCWVLSVESRENDKNSSIYLNPVKGYRTPDWYKMYGNQ